MGRHVAFDLQLQMQMHGALRRLAALPSARQAGRTQRACSGGRHSKPRIHLHSRAFLSARKPLTKRRCAATRWLALHDKHERLPLKRVS